MLMNRWQTLLIVFIALNQFAGAESLARGIVSQPGAPGTPVFSVTPLGPIDLGPSAIGVNTPHGFSAPLQISNTGTADLIVAPSFTSSEYAFTAESTFATPATIFAGGTKQAGILFQPQAAGLRVAQFVSTDNASGSPHTVQLTGTGVNVAPNDFGLALDPAVALVGVPPGKTTSFNVWVLAGPGLSLAPSGTLQCSGGPGGTGCSLASSTFNIDDFNGFSNTRESIAVTVTVPARSATLQRRPGIFWWSVPAVCGMMFAFGLRRHASRTLLISMLMLGSSFLVSCGGSSNAGKNSALLLTATRNGTTHTISVPLSAQ